MAAKQDPLTQAADILVVDDRIASLRMLTEILTEAGYKPRPVEDPQVALEAALAQPPSLILLDVKMPKMSGFEVCRRLKQDQRTRDVPVIFVSALEATEERVQGFKVGAVDFISKPVQEAEVLARVKTHLQLRDTQLYLEALVAERTAELEKLLAERSAALDSAEGQIRILFESARVGIGITTPEGDILSVNQALLGMTGYTEAEIQQLNVRELYFEPAKRSILLERLQESEAVQEFGAQILRKDGTSFYASMNVNKLARDGADVLLAVIEDVSRIVETEEALRSSENLLRVVAENYPAFLSIILKGEQDLTIGLTTGKEFANLGLDPDNFVGMTLEELFGEQAPIVRERYLQAFMGEEVSFELLYNGQNQLYSAYPLLDESGVIGSILVVVQNIDERKLLEAQLAEAAARAERDRLAQDLHDSVSQELYTAGLIAGALPSLWEKDREEGRRALTQLERLTQGASAEMRALLLELRPAALFDQELPALLRQLSDATMARSRTVVTTAVMGNCSPPDQVKIALYRIAQESLNNVVKHAQAGQAWINLDCDGPKIGLRISDNGVGFRPEVVQHESLGLGIVRERAGAIGATVDISSQPDKGTEILVEWQASRQE